MISATKATKATQFSFRRYRDFLKFWLSKNRVVTVAFVANFNYGV